MFDLRDLTVPVVGAPMAGGPGTAALAAAVSNAGGLGFLAAGMRPVDKLADDIAAARRATTGPIGVNLFVPRPSVASAADLARYRTQLAPFAQRYGAAVGQPRPDDEQWSEKLALLAAVRPEVASFTFGTPDRATVTRLHDLGVSVMLTVTSEREARIGVGLGVDALVVQGPLAGGHRGTLDPAAPPPDQPLEQCLAQVLGAHDIPVVAAGGLSTPADVRRVLGIGALAAQLGTALLLADEAGTNPVHRAALVDPAFTATVVTSAFTGRPARGLRNDFTQALGACAPLGYPDVGQLTAPIRAAAVAAGDPHGTNLWSGTGFRRARPAPAATILAGLMAG